MNDKNCIICGETKQLSAFYKHKAMADGHLNKCKDCCKEQNKLREIELRKDPEWIKKEKERAREKYYRLGYKNKHKPTPEDKKIAIQRYKDKYPEKHNAKNKTSHLKPLIKGNHLHHWSYNEEHVKDVIELTEKNHNIIHRYMKYDQKIMMYKTLSNAVLDTREKHEKYINQFIEK